MRRNFRGIQFHDFGYKLGINCKIKFREARQIGSFAKFEFFIYFFILLTLTLNLIIIKDSSLPFWGLVTNFLG